MDFVKPLSATRRAIFGFSVGSSAVDVPQGAGAAISGRIYRAVVDAAVGYQFGRTWETRATYRRGVEYSADLVEPVFTDGFNSTLEGLLTSRLDLYAAAAYTSGESALYRNTSTFSSYTGSVRLRYGLTQKTAVYAEYVYYFYDFRRRTQRPPGLPPVLDRNGVRLGLTLWVPAFSR
jgi:hypothetical protein